MKKMMAACACALVLSGCATRIGDFTVLSTKNMDFNSPNGFETMTGRRVIGEDRQHFFLFFPVTGAADMKEATDKAIESMPGAVGLSNVVLYHTGVYAFLYANGGYRIEGDPVYPKGALPKGGR
jgi:hypothetical protein